MMKRHLLVGSLLLAVAASVGAQETANQEPNLIEGALKATGLSYAKTTSGLSYSVDFNSDDGRTRRILVAVTPSKLMKLRPHLIYTTVWTGDQAPSTEVLSLVMYQTKKYGNFYMFKDSQGKFAVRFGVNFDAAMLSATPQSEDASVKNLKDSILFVNQVGKEVSSLLVGK